MEDKGQEAHNQPGEHGSLALKVLRGEAFGLEVEVLGSVVHFVHEVVLQVLVRDLQVRWQEGKLQYGRSGACT